ncbi:serine/threonine-protein kinase [Streptomyces sp. NBC_00083]|uniref:serine/threonine-protein kinase n=1 Tax=Streptomyces sp. NBC_00083 TaxID=2975647 RepID=UPI002254E050|nr:serine/threonine-protein kinase [Streptomyces sp. NBC_00083]MCX5385121.1 serine/threonine protein kinase [Streptomyces sp. NBC_00083]
MPTAEQHPREPRDRPDSRLIAGRYRLGRRLGRGGMGTVWRAHDELLGRQVAVKELHPEGGAPATAALREARAVAQIKHPHVIVVHDVVEDGAPDDAAGARRSYIVMELVDGGSLADVLAAKGPVGADEAARIGVALLGALATAHARGVLHRDLKPANVLIEEDGGRVVLTDFGIAQVPGTSTISEEGAFVGSPEYTAPERMQGAGAGPESDLWSLGALLCAALSGESPFHRDSLGGVLHAVVIDEIRPPAAARPLLPVVQGLLERDPAHRLGAAEAESLLRAFVATGSTPPRRPTPADRVGPATAAVTKDPPGTAAPPTASSSPSPAPSSAASASAPAPVPGRYAAEPADTPVDSTTSVARPWRKRSLLAGAALVLVLTGAGAAVAVFALDGLGTDRDAAPGTSPSVVAGTPDAGAGPPRSEAPRRPPPPPPPAPEQAAVPPLPDGFRFVRDSDGFGIALPDGYVRSTDAQRVFYTSPDGALKVGIRTQHTVAGGPLGVMRQSAANGPVTNPGYRDGKVTATTHHGHDAALWEFTWNGFTKAEGPRHTYDISWDVPGRMYDVWVSAPVGRLDEAKRTFDTALDSFVPEF